MDTAFIILFFIVRLIVRSKVQQNIIYREKNIVFLKGFLASMGYQKSEKVTLGNYIDKVEVVREVNRQGFSYFG
jgi:hypothetical protein